MTSSGSSRAPIGRSRVPLRECAEQPYASAGWPISKMIDGPHAKRKKATTEDTERTEKGDSAFRSFRRLVEGWRACSVTSAFPVVDLPSAARGNPSDQPHVQRGRPLDGRYRVPAHPRRAEQNKVTHRRHGRGRTGSISKMNDAPHAQRTGALDAGCSFGSRSLSDCGRPGGPLPSARPREAAGSPSKRTIHDVKDRPAGRLTGRRNRPARCE